MNASALKGKLTEFYNGDTPDAHRFRYGLLAFDLGTIVFLIVSSFLHSPRTEHLDAVIGVVIAADFLARMWISNSLSKFLLNPFGAADIVVIISLLAPIIGEGLAFLRVARILRLLRTYQVLNRLRHDFRWFRMHEEMTLSALNLGIFLFVMTAVVYETQRYTNQQISNYVDALYFTVTALTTTGFGDIVLEGTAGRITAVVIMIVGVSLFLRLVQVMLRPEKVLLPCPDCGLQRHERDAVHCKACGKMLAIPDEGSN